MTSRFIQAPSAVVMIRPHRFHPNPETASDNAFQRTDGQLSPREIAYTARSNRANPIPLERFCTHFNFEPMAFDTADENGNSIYHTNVMMCIATDFAMVGFDIISDPERRDEIRSRISEMGRSVIGLTNHQIKEFTGNAIELSTSNDRILAISARAATSLSAEQKETIEQSVRIVELSVPTIELAGGSIRCMLAGIHLARRY